MKVNHEVFCTNLESFLPNQCRKSNPTKNTWKIRSVAATSPCGRKPKPGTACNSKSEELPILPSHFCVTDTKGRVSLPLKILKLPFTILCWSHNRSLEIPPFLYKTHPLFILDENSWLAASVWKVESESMLLRYFWALGSNYGHLYMVSRE